MPSIEIEKLCFSFFRTRSLGTPLFEDLNASLVGPSVIALLGASGSGKSTLLKLIASVLKPQSGIIKMETKAPGRVSWVPQDGGLFPWLTVEQNIAFPLTLSWNGSERSAKVALQHARQIAADLDIYGIRQSFPADVSGGQKQRAAIGRALAAGSEVLLMDEPFSALDPQTRMDVRRLVRKTTIENGMITVVATHDLFDAAYIGDRAVIISTSRPAKLAEMALEENLSSQERSSGIAAAIAARLGTALTDSQIL